MYITSVPNRNSPPAVLLRESYREDGKTKNRTLANLSALPVDAIEGLKILLKGGIALSSVDEVFEITGSRHHGHVQAVMAAMKQLGMPELISSRSCRERDLVLAMVAARILEPDSKLATSRGWDVTTLGAELGVSSASEDDLYAAMDWLIDRQERIEQKLATRHLKEGALALYDLSSSYVEGTECEFAEFGYNRDRKRGTQQVNYGLLTDDRGRPIAVSLYPGNVGDAKTVMDQVELLKKSFKLSHTVLVGDRGMLTQTRIKDIRTAHPEGLDWITALKSPRIRKLIDSKHIQLGLFDERNLFEFTHPDYPGERLIACRNPELAKKQAYTCEELLKATEDELNKIAESVSKGKLKGKGPIGLKVGRVINRYKVAKHFKVTIADDAFTFSRKEESLAVEASLAGLYVIRTSLSAEAMDTDATVRSYKLLSRVERAFRTVKSVDLKVRPIYHHVVDRVATHIFICMLAYYVEWHMREAWREMLFADEDLEAKKHRDPVAPAKPSKAAVTKAQTGRLADGNRAHSFHTLMRELSGIVRNTCRRKGGTEQEGTFEMMTTANETQQRALRLLDTISQ